MRTLFEILVFFGVMAALVWVMPAEEPAPPPPIQVDSCWDMTAERNEAIMQSALCQMVLVDVLKALNTCHEECDEATPLQIPIVSRQEAASSPPDREFFF
jgi:hypothetical protein